MGRGSHTDVQKNFILDFRFILKETSYNVNASQNVNTFLIMSDGTFLLP